MSPTNVQLPHDYSDQVEDLLTENELVAKLQNSLRRRASADGSMRISSMADEEFFHFGAAAVANSIDVRSVSTLNPIYKLPSVTHSIASPPTKAVCRASAAVQTLISVSSLLGLLLDRRNHLRSVAEDPSLVFPSPPPFEKT